MSIKRILILFLGIAVLLSVLVFALVSSRQVDRYYNQRIDETYQKNLQDIKGYVIDGLSSGYLHKATLYSYVEDPIYYIAVYDSAGELLIDSDTANMMGGMMNGMMGGGFSGTPFTFEASHMTADSYPLADDVGSLGTLEVVRETRTANTETSRLFRSSLLLSGLISLAVTLLLIGIVLFFIVRMMNKNVRNLVDYAESDSREEPTYQIAEFNQVAASIDAYRKKLAQKERVKKQKLDQVLHDTKTPLTILKAQLEGVQDGFVQADAETIQTMIGHVASLEVALGDITNVIEGHEKQTRVELTEMNYTEELKKMFSSLKAKFAGKGLDLKLETKGFDIKTNPAVLNKVVYNLLLNSYKYTDKGLVTILTDNEAKTLSITDTGIGIAKEDLDKIFESYYRGRNTGTVEGEGLGLSIVKEQLNLIGATISVKSELGKVTEFIIEF